MTETENKMVEPDKVTESKKKRKNDVYLDVIDEVFEKTRHLFKAPNVLKGDPQEIFSNLKQKVCARLREPSLQICNNRCDHLRKKASEDKGKKRADKKVQEADVEPPKKRVKVKQNDSDSSSEEESKPDSPDSDPLNSDDDISDDPEELLRADDVVFCKFVKVERQKSTWRIQLKDGVAHLGGKDYPFQECNSDVLDF